MADSPVHNGAMLSLSSEAITSNDDLPTTTTTPGMQGPPRAVNTLDTGPSPGRMNRSLQALEAESHAVRLALHEKEQGDKGTSKSYARQVASYQAWWDTSEAAKVAKNTQLAPIPAFPPTVSKVCMFLLYETSREKVCISHFLPRL